MTPRLAPLVATLLVAFARLNAADAPALPQLTAEATRLTEKEFVATGGARLAHKDVVLYADEIVYRMEDSVAVARGNVTLIRGAQRLIADELTYHYADQTYTVGRFRVGQGNVLAEGKRADGDADSLRVQDATVVYGEPDPLSPTLRARTVTYHDAEEKKSASIELEGARLGIGSVNVIPLPKLTETPRSPTISGIDVEVGYDGELGAELSLAATTAVNDSVNLGGDIGIFTKRGVLVGPIGDYDTFDVDGIGARGEFRTGYINDQGDPRLDIRGDTIGSHRGYVEWQHHQIVAPGIAVSGDVNYWSDSYVTRDFRPDQFTHVQTPDTWFEAAKISDNYVVSIFSRVQVNDYSLMQERLPEVRFDGLPVELGGGIYHRVNASVAALREDNPLDATESFLAAGTTRSNRADLYYGLNRPFSPREWFSFTPTAGARVTHYERLSNLGARSGNFTRVLGEVGFDAKAFETSRTWDYKNEQWGIDGLRHIVTPRVSYRLSPSADVGRGDIPAIDRDVFSTYLRPLGLADRRDIDTLPALNTYRFQVDNVLQTRDPGHGSRDLATLSVAIDQYASSEAAATAGQRRDESDAHAFLALTPARWFVFDLYNRVTAQTGKLQELNTGLTLRDADLWSLRFGTHYLEDNIGSRQLQEYTADLGVRLNEIYSLLFQLRYDSRAGQFTEQTYAFRQRLSRTWTVSYELSLYDGPRREDDLGVSVSVETDQF